MTHAFSRGRLLAAAACLSLPCLAQAADTSATAEASIRNLSYRLVDLAPEDGQAPWLTTASSSFISYGVNVAGQSDGGHSAIDPLPAARFTAQVGSAAVAEAGPDAFVTKTAFTGPARLAEGVVLVPHNSHSLDSRAAGVSVWDSPDWEPPKGLLLAPHSQLIFEGQAFLSTTADAAEVLGHDAQPLNLPYQHMVGSNAVIRMSLGGAFGSDPAASWEAESTSSSAFYRSVDGVVRDGALASDSKTLPFLLVLTNHSDQALNATFDWTVQSGSTAWVTQVPEPQTWALALAGLAMVPMVRRLTSRI